MKSAVDPTFPPDGTGVSKAAMRSQFANIKQEIEHGGFFTQAAAGAVAMRVTDRLRQGALSVKDFGAVGDGIADDSAAIEATIEAAGAVSGWDGGKTVYFPKGKYRVTRAVFSHTPPGGSNLGPIHFIGEHGLSSVILLDPASATETWLYDNGIAAAYYFCEWERLGFRGMGVNAAWASGFRLWSAGHEQGFKFDHCFFGQDGGLRRGFLLTGTGNASELHVAHCHIRDVTEAVLTFDNPQAVNVDFLVTHCEGIDGDIFVVTERGGGELRVWGGSYIWGGAITKRWLLKLTGSSRLTESFSFFGIKPEMHEARAGLVCKDGGDGKALVTFSSINFQGTESQYADFEAAEIDANCTVIFENCWLMSQMRYRLVQTSSGDETLNDPGSLLFVRCGLPADFASKVIMDDPFGYASARECWALTATEPTAVDFDLGWTNMAEMGRNVPVKRAVLKTKQVSWPRSSTKSGAPSDPTDDRTVLLPPNARIVGITVFKPADTSATDEYQLKVGPSDRSAVWASSTLGQFKDPHIINAQLPPDQWIDVGRDANTRRVTMWADPGGGETIGSGNLPGEVAFVEYL